MKCGTLLTIESPAPQWLEHPARSRRVVGLNPIWNSDFFRVDVISKFNIPSNTNFGGLDLKLTNSLSFIIAAISESLFPSMLRSLILANLDKTKCK